MPFTNYFDKALLELCFGAVAFTPPDPLYVALSTTTPTQYQGSGGGWNFTEPTSGGYHRTSVAADAWSGQNINSGFQVVNTSQIAFPTSTGVWANGNNLTYVGIFDAASGGNLLAFGPVSPAIPVSGPGTTPTFGPGVLSISAS